MKLALFRLVLALLPACAVPVEVASIASPPQPTEHLLDEDAESRHKQARKDWIERMHHSGPGVDWRAIERANGLAEQGRRNLLASAPAQAQLWGEVGSANLAGRMHCAALGPDGATLYAGSSLGGLWRGNLDGTGWTPHGDNLYGGVHEVVALPGENTGEPDVLVTTTDGGFVRVTRDLGATWETPSGLGALIVVRGLAALADGRARSWSWASAARPGTPRRCTARPTTGAAYAERSSNTAASASMWVPRIGPLVATHVCRAQRKAGSRPTAA